MAGRIEFRVFDRVTGAADPFGNQLSTLSASEGKEWREVANDTGSGSFRLALDDADVVHTYERNLVRAYLDEQPAFPMVIEPSACTQTTVGAEPTAESEERNVVCRGTLALWEEAVVMHEEIFVPLAKRRSTSRRFDFASARMAIAAPTVVTELPTVLPNNNGFPPGFPDPNAKRIWSRALDVNGSHPAGSSYFVLDFTTFGITAKAAICFSADDACEVYLDGALLQAELVDPYLHFKWHRIDVEINESLFHRLSFRVVNRTNPNPNPAWLLACVAVLDGSGTPTAIPFSTKAGAQVGTVTGWSSTAGWRCFDYPASPPSATPGAIIDQLLTEAQNYPVYQDNPPTEPSRGKLTDISLGFTETHDSDGVAWPAAPGFSAQVGQSYLDVLRSLAELHCDIAMAPDALRLDAWVRRGQDRSGTVEFAVGEQILGLEHRGAGTGAPVDSVLARHGEQWLHRLATAAPGVRREVFSSLSATSDAQAQLMIDALLAEHATQVPGATLHYETVTGTVPYSDFGVGDDAMVPNDRLVPTPGRVKALSVGETELDYEWSAEIGSLSQELVDQLQRIARKTQPGALDADFYAAEAAALKRAAEAVITSSDQVPAPPVAGLLDVSSTARPVHGAALAFDAALGTGGEYAPSTAFSEEGVVTFSGDGPVTVRSSGPKRYRSTRTVTAFTVALATAGTTTTTVVVRKNGVAIPGASLSLTSGSTFGSLTLPTPTSFTAGVDVLTAAVTVAGTDAQTITIDVWS